MWPTVTGTIQYQTVYGLLPGGPQRTVRSDGSGSQGKLSGVQIARGVAALTVVLYHATRGLSLPQYLGYIPFDNSLGFGHAGVDFFFVLSGFIIMYAHTADIGKAGTALPIHVASGHAHLSNLLGRYIDPGNSGLFFPRILPSGWTLSHIVHSLLLWPETTEPLVGVGWTLPIRDGLLLGFCRGHSLRAPVQTALSLLRWNPQRSV